MIKVYFNIDILGTGACNLSCPSCPVGNTSGLKLPRGIMSIEFLEKILIKAKSECEVTGVSLFSWTEPMLHPKLPEMVHLLHRLGLQCHLSTNANRLNRIDDLMASNPYELRISNSGFTQNIYSLTHRGGDVETVKANMARIAFAKRKSNATTYIQLLYHQYSTNITDEKLMQSYCNELGIDFTPILAFMMPLEKVLDYAEGRDRFTEEDREVINRLLLPLDAGLEASRRASKAACTLQTDQMTLDFLGNVQLCCATYDSTIFGLGNYLDSPIQTFQNIKFKHPVCLKCKKVGINTYYTYGSPEFIEIANRRRTEILSENSE